MNDVSPENLLKQIDVYLTKQNYREAYSVWERLKQLQDDGTLVSADLTDLFRTLNRGAQSQRQALVARLEATFAPGIDTLQRDLGIETQSTLDSLYDASLPDDEYDYQRLKARFESLKAEQQHRREYENARAIVEGYWLQAEKAASETANIAVANLLVYYDQALAATNEASENSPQNVLLKQLVLEARAQRERFADEEEIMTSGGQTDDFVKVLKHVNSLKEGETVMVYDNAGVPTSRMTQQAARADVIKNAKLYVDSKATVYAQEANDALKADNPREAKSWLERYQKFIDLDEYAAGENILTGRQRDTYNQLQRQVNDAIVRLEDAEKTAERAASESEQDAFRAWNLYIGALRRYAGTARSTRVKQAAERITAATLSQVKQQLAVINTQLETFDYQDAFKAVNTLNEAFEAMWEALNTTDGLVDAAQTILKSATSEFVTERAAIEVARKAAQEGIDKKAAISKALRSITELSASEPQKAKGELDALISKYGAPLVQADRQYSEVNSRVKTVVDAAGLLEDFKASLALNSLNDVRKKQEEAQDASERVADATYKRRFGEVAVLLGFKVRLLEAEARRYQDGDAKTIDVYESVRREPALEESLRQEVVKRLGQLREELTRTESNKAWLEQAESALADGKIDDVWRFLSQVQRFSDESQSQRWLTLLNRSAGLARVDMPFNLTAYKTVSDLAREYSTQTAESFVKQTRKCVDAQNARDAEIKGDLDTAFNLWDKGKASVSGEEAEYFTLQANRLQKQVTRAEFQRRMRKLQEVDGEALTPVLGDIKEFLENLRIRAVSASNPTDKLEYATWAAEAELAYALNHPNMEERHKTLRSIGQNVDSIESALNAYAASFNQDKTRYTLRISENEKPDELLQQTARKFLAWVKAGYPISEALRDVELYVIKPKEEDDVSLFEQAVNKWNSRFADAPLKEGYLTLLGWYERQTGALRSELVTTLAKTEKTEKGYLLSGARLLMLNPRDVDGKKMLNTLESIDAILDKSLVSLLNRLPASENESAQSQIEQLEARVDYLKLLDQVLGFAFVPTEISTRQKPYVSRWMNRLEGTMQYYQTFKVALHRFENGVRDVDFDNWQEATDSLDKLYADLETKVQQIGDALETHLRDVKGVQAQSFKNLTEHYDMSEARRKLADTKSSVTKVSDICNKLKKLAESDDFTQALEVIYTAEARIDKDDGFKELWKDSPIPSVLTVHFTDGKTARSWDIIKAEVVEREARLRRVLQWEKKQGKAIGWDTLTDELKKLRSEKQDDAHKALIALYQNRDFSQAIKLQITALADEGRFAEAQRLLKTVREGDAATLRGYVSLKDTQAYFKKYPLADTEDAYTEDIERAREVAGSQTARAILETTYRTAQNAQAAFNDAETLSRTLLQRTKGWNDLIETAQNKLTAIDDFLKKHRRVRRGEAAKLEELVEGYQRHIEKMRDEYRYHLELDDYENAPILDEARNVLRQQR